MIKRIILTLIALAISLSIWNGKFSETILSCLDSTVLTFKIAGTLGLTIVLWMGMMRIAQAIGLMQGLGQYIQPIIQKLFPEIPKDHPALSLLSLNISANMFGMGNAATPLGLQAMKELDKLNPQNGIASNAMCTLLAINTSSIQLIPTGAMAILAAGGCSDPTSIIFPALLATICSTIVGVSAAKIMEKLPFNLQREKQA